MPTPDQLRSGSVATDYDGDPFPDDDEGPSLLDDATDPFSDA